MVAEATEEHPKTARAMSSEDEVARLTIEVELDHPLLDYISFSPPLTLTTDDECG